MKIFIVLSIALVLMATTGIVAATALYDKATKAQEYKTVRDTVLIDTYKDKGLGKADHYELYYTDDSLYVYDAKRLVAVFEAWDTKVDSVLIADNE